jgi:hypothetical protein
VNKCEARRLADEDTTPYGVLSRGRTGYGLIHVTGYRNAKIMSRPGDLILTASEVKRVRAGWRPDMEKEN